MSVEVGIKPQYELLTEEFELTDDVVIPAGSYRFSSFEIEGSTQQTKSYSSLFQYETSQFYDGWRSSFSVATTASISSSIKLTGTYEYNNINFSEIQQEFNVHLVSLNALYMHSIKVSFASIDSKQQP